MQNRKVGTFFSFHIHEQVKVCTLKLLWDIMSHLATKMPHLALFEGSKRHGAPSDGVPPFPLRTKRPASSAGCIGCTHCLQGFILFLGEKCLLTFLKVLVFFPPKQNWLFSC